MLNMYLGTAHLLRKFCPEFNHICFNKIYQNITSDCHHIPYVALLVNLALFYFLFLFFLILKSCLGSFMNPKIHNLDKLSSESWKIFSFISCAAQYENYLDISKWTELKRLWFLYIQRSKQKLNNWFVSPLYMCIYKSLLNTIKNSQQIVFLFVCGCTAVLHFIL